MSESLACSGPTHQRTSADGFNHDSLFVRLVVERADVDVEDGDSSQRWARFAAAGVPQCVTIESSTRVSHQRPG